MKDSVFITLAKYDSYFYTATSADFIRGLTKNEMKELTEAAKEVGIIYTHNGCPKCCLDFIKKLAVPYYKEKEERAKKVKEAAKRNEQLSNKEAKKKNLKKGDKDEREESQKDERQLNPTEEVRSETSPDTGSNSEWNDISSDGK